MSYFIRHQSITCTLCSVLMSFSIALSVNADELTIFGLKFPVDRIVEVDENSTSVTIQGQTLLLAKTKLRAYVANRILESELLSKTFESEQLRTFFKNALESTELDYSADLAMQSFFVLAERDLTEGKDTALQSLIQQSRASAQFNAVARKILANERSLALPGPYLLELIYSVGLEDPDWLLSHSQATLSKLSIDLESFINERLKQALLAGDFKHSLKIVAIASRVFGAEDSRYQRVRFLHDEVSRLSSFFEVGDLASVYPSLDAARKDPVLKDLVSPLLLKAIHREASKMLSQDRPDAALLALKDVELSRRTSTTHKLVEDAIERLKPGLNSVLTDLQVELMLRSLALKDPYISKAYLIALQDQLRFLADSDRVESAYKLLERILEIRPDPAQENDLARLHLSLAALDSGDRGLARSILNGKTGRLGLFNGLRLIFAGYYFSVWFIYILFAIALASAAILLFKSLPRLKFKSETIGTGIRRNAMDVMSSEESVGPRFTSPRVRDYQLEEYEENMALFGLHPGSSEKEIKAAYRNAVKEFHPDANPDANTLASEKFIELTNAYNKIVSFIRDRFDREEKE